jgi:tryptophan synthase alpha subunit
VATCCLFLAGKAEETPKKCKDLIRTVRTLTNDRQFATFGVDPREEVMVIERVLLQVSIGSVCVLTAPGVGFQSGRVRP